MATRELVIVGGANGSGKTTFAVDYAERHEYLYLGADAIAAELAPDNPSLVPLAAGKELMRRLAVALGGQKPVVLESTLAGLTLQHTIRKARDAGFSVIIMYLYLDSPEMCIDRVLERARKGGHSVPEDDIRRRFFRSVRNFWGTYRPLVDRWLLVYNSWNRPLDVAFGAGEGISIRDMELYAIFSQWLEGDHDG